MFSNSMDGKVLPPFYIFLLAAVLVGCLSTANAQCNPACDGVSSVCINDTDLWPYCYCYYGYESPTFNDTTCDLTVVDDTTNTTNTTNAFDENTKNIISYIGYLFVLWITLWCLATIIVCAVYNAWGHHRILHLLEEITFIIVEILIGGLAMNLNTSEGGCRVVSAMLHYFFLCTMMLFVLESVFAYGNASGIVVKDGVISPYANYVLFWLVPLLPFGLSIGFLMEYYGANGIHCWCDLSTGQAWAFFIPIVALFFTAGIFAESTNVKEYQLLPDTDLYQLNWSQKSVGSLLIFMLWTMISYFIGIVAMDTQSFWVFILFYFFVLIHGPMIFVNHTQGHYQTAKPLNEKFPFLPWYKDTEPPSELPNVCDPEKNEKDRLKQQKEADELKAQNAAIRKEHEDDDTDWVNFWQWVTNRDDQDVEKESEQVLFEKKKVQPKNI